MPRGRKKETATTAPTTRGKRKAEVEEEVKDNSSKRRKPEIDKKRITSDLFTKYSEKTEDGQPPVRIGPDGITTLCEDLGISLTGIETLIMAWKFNAEEMGYFTRDEFMDGMERVGAYDIDSLRSSIKSINKELKITSSGLLLVREDRSGRITGVRVVMPMALPGS
eukprot:TRINITY_DN57_c0_g1_i2.p2 TRINITY_DN57_c0_g1~~TRINITY_DN57_c0_g1_i2.p2  ORF type:complete len:166 (-),score=31.40 TRINITY_DN57_c0_g1_i2:42-539(-)